MNHRKAPRNPLLRVAIALPTSRSGNFDMIRIIYEWRKDFDDFLIEEEVDWVF